MSTDKPKFKAYFCLTLAQCMVGANVTLAKYIIDNMPANIYLGLRFWIASLILGLFLLLARYSFLGDMKDGLLSRRLLLLLTFQGFTGSFLFNLFMGIGLEYTSATSAGIVCSTLPAFIAIMSFIFLKEKITKPVFWSIVLAVIGLLLLNLDNLSAHQSTANVGSILGDFLVLLAIIPEAAYSIIGKFVGKKINFFVGAFWVNFTTAVLFTPILLASWVNSDYMLLTPELLGWVSLSALFSVIFFSSWMMGLSEVPASKAGVFGSIMPVTAALAAIVFLGEKFNIYNGIGMLFVLVSIFVGTLKEKRGMLKSVSALTTKAT